MFEGARLPLLSLRGERLCSSKASKSTGSDYLEWGEEEASNEINATPFLNENFFFVQRGLWWELGASEGPGGLGGGGCH